MPGSQGIRPPGGIGQPSQGKIGSSCVLVNCRVVAFVSEGDRQQYW